MDTLGIHSILGESGTVDPRNVGSNPVLAMGLDSRLTRARCHPSIHMHLERLCRCSGVEFSSRHATTRVQLNPSAATQCGTELRTTLSLHKLDHLGFYVCLTDDKQCAWANFGHISSSRGATRTLQDSVGQIVDMVAPVRSSETVRG